MPVLKGKFNVYKITFLTIFTFEAYLHFLQRIWEEMYHIVSSYFKREVETVARQALSMEFSRQEYWSGVPFPSKHY